MGAWGTGIKDNDTSSEIYGEFFDYYNDGMKPEIISNKIIAKHTDLIDDPEEFTNFWFALALAQWETVSLNNMVFEKVNQIIETEIDLKIWRELEGEENDIKKRKIALDKFLLKIKNPKVRPVAKRKPKNPKYNAGDCLSFKLLNGNFGGAIILEAEHKSKFGFNLIALTRINQKEKPELIDYIKSEVLHINCPQTLGGAFIGWFPANGFRKTYNDLFELVGKIEVNATFDIEGEDKNDINPMYCGDWIALIETTNKQFEHEKNNIKATKILTIKKLIRY